MEENTASHNHCHCHDHNHNHIHEHTHNHEHDSSDLPLNVKEPSKDDFEILASLFKLLDDPTRLQLFLSLCHVEECVVNLASMLELSSPALSHHLRILKENNLIVSRREGKEVFYTAANTLETKTLHHFIEQIMKISCPERQKILCKNESIKSADLSEKEEIFHQIHDYLTSHLSERITIEDLSRKFLMNTTTLKNGFKSVYGTSIAAHINEHRMEHAADLLVNTNQSVSEIAKSVGYASSSKFSSAFSEVYHFSPLEYRKRNG